MACRKFLLKLERNGLITLPPPRRQSPNSLRNKEVPFVSHSTTKLRCQLSTQCPLIVTKVKERTNDSALFNYLLSKYHYLGFINTVGENLKYLVKNSSGTPLSCLLYSSAAWKTQPRDAFIGWDAEIRQKNLIYIANNTRFLIFPWVNIENLASHLLSLISKRIGSDWMIKYGHPVYLLETFADRSRFSGTSYKAAGWNNVGQTKGRTREDRHHSIKCSIKDIYLYPLSRRFRQELTCGH